MSTEDFNKAVNFAQTSKGIKLDTATQLRFYGLYKVATDGICKTAAPSRLKVTDYTKYQAYKKASGEFTTQEQAKAAYIKELTAKVPNWSKGPVDAKL